jgi:hypothetical protein
MEALIVLAMVIVVIIAVIRFVVTRDSKTLPVVEPEAPYKIETPTPAPEVVKEAPVVQPAIIAVVEATAPVTVTPESVVAPAPVKTARPKAAKPKAVAAKAPKPKAPKMTIVK